MKLNTFIIALFMLFLLSVSNSFSQKYSYYIDGKLTEYVVSSNTMVLRLKADYDIKEWKKVIATRSEIISIDELKAIEGVLILKFEDKSGVDIETKISDFEKDDKVVYATPFLINSEGFTIGALTNEFIVKLKQSSNFDQLKQFAQQYFINDFKQYEFNEYTLVHDKK